jgi:hypothetical protein
MRNFAYQIFCLFAILYYFTPVVLLLIGAPLLWFMSIQGAGALALVSLAWIVINYFVFTHPR